ncbi:MAG: hypothetical protein UZ14_CFX002001167 [Chloroflexi bacterium OLB14]|nr:MAG: hypothetical protein UZ14_CFX002001167 [Chloroflexi bacterium OLB14]
MPICPHYRLVRSLAISYLSSYRALQLSRSASVSFLLIQARLDWVTKGQL